LYRVFKKKKEAQTITPSRHEANKTGRTQQAELDRLREGTFV
jgi:hypothetical protein